MSRTVTSVPARVDEVARDLKGAGIRPSRPALEARLAGLSVREATVRAAWINAIS